MKTSELTGAALDWAVAMAIGDYTPVRVPTYSTDWAHGGAIIEREKISLIYMGFAHEEYWVGSIDAVRREHEMFNGIDLPFEYEEKADTPLVAAMRCYVASKLGDEVQLPEGL
jgi:hypothetical protein